MNPIPVNLAVEDELSEVTLYRILDIVEGFAVGTPYRRGGFGYLRRTIFGWNQAAKSIPFIVLTDLDNYECPAELIKDWLEIPKHQNLLFRVAVREVESWILADTINFAVFLGIKSSLIPLDTDSLSDPKNTLVQLARKSKSKLIRDSIVPTKGSTAKQGPDYNGCLCTFVREKWNLNAAKTNSPSLARTVDRLSSFTPTW
jgi:hypothetical protein